MAGWFVGILTSCILLFSHNIDALLREYTFPIIPDSKNWLYLLEYQDDWYTAPIEPDWGDPEFADADRDRGGSEEYCFLHAPLRKYFEAIINKTTVKALFRKSTETGEVTLINAWVITR